MSEQPPPKLIQGDRFIAALIDAGLLPGSTVALSIHARIGEPVEMTYDVYGDERLIAIAKGGIEATDDPNEARAR